MRVILGAGVAGLAAGITAGSPVFEAAGSPGGICRSYYMRPGSSRRLDRPPSDGEAYRFELGGGHWIFGGDDDVLQFIERMSPTKRYVRRSAVRLQRGALSVPYPLQNHLDVLGVELAAQARAEMASSPSGAATMRDWLSEVFGPTLCRLFFHPFQDRYTAGLYRHIVPQDAYKTPVSAGSGYNPTFAYPALGLDHLVGEMAALCRVNYDMRAVAIDGHDRVVFFEDETAVRYDSLISTLPLNVTAQLAHLDLEASPDPCTSVLVVNIGAERGEAFPDEHWLYMPDTDSGHYRVGAYSNVDASFLPASARRRGDQVSLYVERAYVGGSRPSPDEQDRYIEAVVAELQGAGFIGTVDVVDPTWIEVAYTWSYPGSEWREEAIRGLGRLGIHQVGRYGRWTFQGIADSIRDGFVAGCAPSPR
jgi:protoporphyrinogen oxidase